MYGGGFTDDGILLSNIVSLVMYPTTEDTIVEIDEIEKFILNNQNGVYTMKSNE